MTTTPRARVLWIDDKPEHKRDADNLSDSNLQVDFTSRSIGTLKPNELTGYDLLLVDYRLDGRQVQGRPVTGPAVVGLLRSVDDDTPAYVLSSESAQARARFFGLTWFEESLSLDELQDVQRMRVRLKDDIAGYRAIRAVRRRTNPDHAISDLLDVPEASKPALLEAVPASIKATLVRSADAPAASGAPEVSGILGFARWVRRVLLVKPGALLPTLHAATRVGMKPKRFARSRPFSIAAYGGIFSKGHEARWWAAALDDIVFARQRRSTVGPGLPWELGPKLFRVPKRDQPTCEVCGEPYPEMVARDVDTGREASVHQRHCSPDPNRDFTPFFAEERVFSVGE